MAPTKADIQSNDIIWFSANDISACTDLLNGTKLHAVARRAWADIVAGSAYGLKSTISIPSEDLRRYQFLDSTIDLPERLGWKLSCLSSVNSQYGAVKVVGANALNRRFGLPRSRSTVLLFDKLTMTPLCAMDGTELSAARTASYATLVMERFFAGRKRLSIFIFGAGPIAENIILSLQAYANSAIDKLVVRSRSNDSAERLVAKLKCQVSFAIQASKGVDDLTSVDFIITATNAKSPVFEPDQVETALILHLGGDETPSAYLEKAIRSGRVFCDNVEMVSRRNSQSLALYFSLRGATLEQLGPFLGIRNLSEFNGSTPINGPVHITCVGLPMLDLYVAAHVYETLRERKDRTSQIFASRQ